MDSREQIAAHLREYLDAHYSTQREAARKIGLTPGHLSNYLNAREGISRASAEKIQAVHPEISISYLVMGNGSLTTGMARSIDPSTDGRTPVGSDHSSPTTVLEEENRRLRDELAKANEEKDRLLGIIESLTRKN